MSDCIFYKASIKDAEIITKNNIYLAEEIEQLQLNFDEALKGSKFLIQHSEYGFYFLCKKDDHIIGQLLVTYEWSDWRNKMIWWIHRIYVKPSWRKKGILKKMMKQIEISAEKDRIFTVRIYVHKENKSAFPIYKKIGFKNTPFHILQLRSFEL